MGSLLGLRPPNFSEDVAWLPAWLQDPYVDSSNHHIQFGQTEFDQVFKKNQSIGDFEAMSSRDEGRYKSCHLFLSGESNSPASLAPSSGNALSLHLHLSHDVTSQTFPSQLLDTSQGRITSNNFSSQRIERPSAQEEIDNRLREDDKVDLINFPHLTSHQETSEFMRRPSISKDNSCDISTKVNDKYLDAEDVNEAVELSIAASEVLTIHDILKSSLQTNSLGDASLLEVALRVKQARMGNLEESFWCPADYTDDIDLLTEVDDFEMEDAFEDVGLCISCPNTSYVCAPAKSLAKDIPNPENYSGHDEKNIYEVNVTPKVGLDPTRGLNSASVESSYHISSHNSVVPNSNVSAATEVKETRENFSMDHRTSFQPQAFLISPQTERSLNTETPEELNGFGSDKFQSRWLGGWSFKNEPIACPPVKRNSAKIIPQPMVCETSYLSESEDIAPDINSAVQAQSKASLIASQSSVLFEGSHGKTFESMLLSQDIVQSSSLVDPLCSVVPCSVSSEIACSSLDQNPNDQGNAAEYCNVDLQSTPGLDADYVLKEREVFLSNSKGSQPTVRRHFTSLRPYSVHPSCIVVVEEDGMNCTRLPSAENGSAGAPRVNSLNRSSNSKETGENYQTSVLKGSLGNTMNKKNDFIEATQDGATICMTKDKKSPLVLNRGRRCRFKSLKELVHDSVAEEILQEPMMQASKEELVLTKKLKTSHSKEEISCQNKVPARKRVRFLETHKQLQQEIFQKMHSSLIDCSTSRSGKRLRRTNTEFKSRVHGLRKDQANFLRKEIRRPIFHDIEFLLTGFSSQKEKEIDILIRKYGGTVLSEIPNPTPKRKRSSSLTRRLLPVILCPRKLDTTKFLYGCAVNAFILKVKWLTDSIERGSTLNPDKYMIIRSNVGENSTRIRRPRWQNNQNLVFEGVGIMLHGHHSFCTRFTQVLKHGGGQVFKTLQPLVQNLDAGRLSVGVIVAEDESRPLRHLKHCASEGKIPMMPASWIIDSLHAGKLQPLAEEKNSPCLRRFKILDLPASILFSQEI